MALVVLAFAHIAVPLIYILWMKRIASTRPWNVGIGPSYTPIVTVILATYNEEKVITARLQNLLTVDYPKERMEVIVVDSASSDNTVSLARAFANQHPELDVKVMEEESRKGKTKAMNLALQASRGEVIVTTDADTYWAPNALKMLLPYLSDPSVGAVTGVKVPLNPSQSSATASEVTYYDAYESMRVGESKLHSTLVLQGELTAYKRQAFNKFDEESGSDDTGTAITIVQKGLRCLQVPEAKTYHYLYRTWRGNMVVKVRRAQQMIYLWLKSIRLMLRGDFKVPRSIMVPTLYLHLFNPFVGVFFYAFATLAIIQYPMLILPSFILVALPVTRRYVVSFVTHNAFLLIGFWRHMRGERQVVWRRVRETRVAMSKPTHPRTLALEA